MKLSLESEVKVIEMVPQGGNNDNSSTNFADFKRKFKSLPNEISFSELVPSFEMFFTKSPSTSDIPIQLTELIDNLCLCRLSFDESLGIEVDQQSFTDFKKFIISSSFLRYLVAGYINGNIDSVNVHIKGLHEEWDEHLSEQQGNGKWTEKKFVFLHGLISRLCECWKKSLPKVLVMIRLVLSSLSLELEGS